MLEQCDLGPRISKATYRRQLPRLQKRLYDLAHAAYTHRVPIVVVFEGWAAAGKGSTINALTERLDARGFRVVPTLPARTQEKRYPWLWRFWLKVPAYGQMVIFDNSWYRRVLIERIDGVTSPRQVDRAFHDIAEFEETLVADGTIVLKFWLHISKSEQARRFQRLLRDELTAWQVTDEDRAQHRAYKEYRIAVEEMLARTDLPFAPWTLVEATHKHSTRVRVFETMIAALESRLGSVTDAR